jgi:hypothetical protein
MTLKSSIVVRSKKQRDGTLRFRLWDNSEERYLCRGMTESEVAIIYQKLVMEFVDKAVLSNIKVAKKHGSSNLMEKRRMSDKW